MTSMEEKAFQLQKFIYSPPLDSFNLVVSLDNLKHSKNIDTHLKYKMPALSVRDF